MEWIEKVLSQLSWALAGLFGAAVAVPFQRDLRGKRAIATFIISGSIIAHFMTRPVCTYFSIEVDSSSSIGFLLGAFGGAVIAAVLKSIEAADIWSIIRSRFGGGAQ